MKYFRKHRKVIILLIVFIVLVFLFFAFYNGVFSNSNSKYGNRLDGMDSVKLDNNKMNSIRENVGTLDICKKVSVRLSGKILYVTSYVKDDIDVGKSKEIAGKVLESLSDDEKKFYDIQIIIDKENDEKFPIIGYKHHSHNDVTWTKDR